MSRVDKAVKVIVGSYGVPDSFEYQLSEFINSHKVCNILQSADSERLIATVIYEREPVLVWKGESLEELGE